jgi:hypothetical protein
MQGNPCPRFVLPFPLQQQPKPTAIDERKAVRAFVTKVGGVDNARRAIELLSLLSGEDVRREAA